MTMNRRMLIAALGVALLGCDMAGVPARMTYGRGRVALDAGDYEAAIELFTKALRLDPNMAVAYNDRGLAELKGVPGEWRPYSVTSPQRGSASDRRGCR